MASPTPLTLTDLKPESDLLHLLFHRNKNQHRSSKWWKWLGMLRRNIKKLLDPAAAAGVEKRVEYMKRVVVPSCYTAFTSVIANAQFAPLGLTLLGVLARIHKIVGVEERNEEKVGAEVVAAGPSLVKTGREAVMELDTEDFGEAIVRREEVAEEEENIVIQKKTTSEILLEGGGLVTKLKEPSKERLTSKDAKSRGEKATKEKKKAIKSISTSPPPRLLSPLPLVKEEKLKTKSKRKSDDKEGTKKKKKRKKADEIDDLFAGLL